MVLNILCKYKKHGFKFNQYIWCSTIKDKGYPVNCICLAIAWCSTIKDKGYPVYCIYLVLARCSTIKDKEYPIYCNYLVLPGAVQSRIKDSQSTVFIWH